MDIKNIGWIGAGVMGGSMAKRLLNAGFSIAVSNRTKSKAAELLDKGAVWRHTPAEVAEKSEIIFSIVGFPRDVEEVMLGHNGVLSKAKTGSIIVDMTTSEPKLAERISQAAKEKGISSLDAPVSGGDVGARDGKLAIMAGGEHQTFKKVLPIFQILGETIAYMGPAGNGQHAKMCNQIMIASTMIGVVESLLYSVKAGLNPDELIDIIGKGAAGAWCLNNLGKRITAGDFDPGFYIKHFIKDMGIALTEAKRMKLALPGLSTAYQLYISASALGYENLGTHGLYKVLQQMNGMN